MNQGIDHAAALIDNLVAFHRYGLVVRDGDPVQDLGRTLVDRTKITSIDEVYYTIKETNLTGKKWQLTPRTELSKNDLPNVKICTMIGTEGKNVQYLYPDRLEKFLKHMQTETAKFHAELEKDSPQMEFDGL